MLRTLMESPALYPGVGRDDLIKLYFYEGYDYRLIINKILLSFLRPWDIFIPPLAEEDIARHEPS